MMGMIRVPRTAFVLLIGFFAFTSARASLAQPARETPPATGVRAAEIAFNQGRLADVDRLVARLDARQPDVALLRARLARTRGQYADAVKLLEPVVARVPAGDAALELGDLERWLGAHDRAQQIFSAALEALAAKPASTRSPQEQMRLAQAYQGLGRFQEANTAFRAAAQATKDDPVINTAWGRLLLEKHNPSDAAASFRSALAGDPQWEPAIAGLAEATADDNPPQAQALLTQALSLNPADVDAWLFNATLALDQGNDADARSAIAKALAINAASPRAHAMLAGLAYVDGRQPEHEQELARAKAANPADTEVYRIVADVLARNYRFDEAATIVRQAIAIDADDAESQAMLGLDLLRTGDEAGARTALDRAFKLDPYNVVTYNLLSLLDTLDKFTTIRDGDLTIRLSTDEAPVLKPYVVPLAHKALDTLSATYGFTPKGPILIEVFPHHDDFAVRNLGLPGMIGVLGACFGRVVTLDSPHARPPGTFLWEATLWHELAHVVTLQMSNQRVPRWLTEGISVYEEGRARPEWGRNMEVSFARAMDAHRVLTLHDLDSGFSDPRMVSLAYYEASLVVDFIVRQYGQPALNALLRAYGQGLSTDAALQQALKIDLDTLQRGFDASLNEQFEPLRRALRGPDPALLRTLPPRQLFSLARSFPTSYAVQMAFAQAMRARDDPRRAMSALERAARLVPTATGENSPHAQMADIAIAEHDFDRAISELQALLTADHENIDAARKLAGLLEGSNDAQALEAAYGRIEAIDPFDASAHSELGRLALQRRDTATALREFQVALAAGPMDMAAARTDLAETYFATGDHAGAKRETLAALELAPLYPRAQDLLLKLEEGQQ
jgi:tetratricopeptide (TPR) repeat protein